MAEAAIPPPAGPAAPTAPAADPLASPYEGGPLDLASWHGSSLFHNGALALRSKFTGKVNALQLFLADLKTRAKMCCWDHPTHGILMVAINSTNYNLLKVPFPPSCIICPIGPFNPNQSHQSTIPLSGYTPTSTKSTDQPGLLMQLTTAKPWPKLVSSLSWTSTHLPAFEHLHPPSHNLMCIPMQCHLMWQCNNQTRINLLMPWHRS